MALGAAVVKAVGVVLETHGGQQVGDEAVERGAVFVGVAGELFLQAVGQRAHPAFCGGASAVFVLVGDDLQIARRVPLRVRCAFAHGDVFPAEDRVADGNDGGDDLAVDGDEGAGGGDDGDGVATVQRQDEVQPGDDVGGVDVERAADGCAGSAVGEAVDQRNARDHGRTDVALVQRIEQAEHAGGRAQVAGQCVTAAEHVDRVVDAHQRSGALQVAHRIPVLQADDAVHQADGSRRLLGLLFGLGSLRRVVLGLREHPIAHHVDGTATEVLELQRAIGLQVHLANDVAVDVEQEAAGLVEGEDVEAVDLAVAVGAAEVGFDGATLTGSQRVGEVRDGDGVEVEVAGVERVSGKCSTRVGDLHPIGVVVARRTDVLARGIEFVGDGVRFALHRGTIRENNDASTFAVGQHPGGLSVLALEGEAGGAVAVVLDADAVVSTRGVGGTDRGGAGVGVERIGAGCVGIAAGRAELCRCDGVHGRTREHRAASGVHADDQRCGSAGDELAVHPRARRAHFHDGAGDGVFVGGDLNDALAGAGRAACADGLRLASRLVVGGVDSIAACAQALLHVPLRQRDVRIKPNVFEDLIDDLL